MRIRALLLVSAAVVLSGALLAVALWLRKDRQLFQSAYLPSRQVSDNWFLRHRVSTEIPTFFVSVPSFRDPECAKTVADLLQKAKYPEQIFVGICDQRLPHEESVLSQYHKLAAEPERNWFTRLRVYEMDARNAKGPLYARAIIQQNLYNGEQYVVSIDSHMRFVDHWDKKISRQLQRIPEKFQETAILTCYPAGYDIGTGAPEKDGWVSYLRPKGFNPDGFLELEGPRFFSRPHRPVQGLFLAMGFSIVPRVCYARTRIPQIPHLFFGEEILMAALYSQLGATFWHPSVPLAFHAWSRHYRPSYFKLRSAENARQAKRQFFNLWNRPEIGGAFEEKTGFSLRRRHQSERAKRGLLPGSGAPIGTRKGD
jgi:[Skp1-protein]-hydroxyproline N-acetylglucosaminyltransferase